MTTVKVVRSPYLVTVGTEGRGVSVGITADASTTVVEMTMHGQWSSQLGNQVTTSLRLCLAGPTTTVIIDLHDVGDLHGVSLPFWAAAVRAARLGPPPVQLMLCLPPGTMLDYRLRHLDGEQPLMFTTMSQARVANAGRLSRTHRRLQVRLPPRPSAVQAARNLVVQACHAWQLSPLRHDASLIMSELAANAVEHARTDIVATVLGAGSRLHLAVRDGDTRYPRLTVPAVAGGAGPLQERGRGLRLVDAVAAAWGAMPARGGKVVWATVSLDPAEVFRPC